MKEKNIERIKEKNWNRLYIFSKNWMCYFFLLSTGEGEVMLRTLHVLSFDSHRKRMSVIVENPQTKEIILYCKGADSAIFTNLKPKTPGGFIWNLLLFHLSVLEHTPSISFEFYFIINRWTIYIITSCLIDRWHANKCLLSFDLHTHGVTSFKHWSLISPAASQTLGDIFVYALPKWQPNLPKMSEKGSFLLHSLSQRRYIYRWRSIY